MSITHALMDMSIGTDDHTLAEIRTAHAACRYSDCPHLAAFDAQEAVMQAAGRRWRNRPAQRHQRPARTS
ncbi:hypothetical protein ACIBL8_43445 [Streptomyces sp. NPDC050523]|uniref:hypothetical protein n=1 Tax=Streptomyces sp. NPDC050523 TaxID=3365622 RepID=UPI00378EF242